MINTQPEYVTIRLLPAEAAQLKTIIAIESAKTSGRRITMKAYILEMITRAAFRKQYVPIDRVVAPVKTSDIAQRISLKISPTHYEALGQVRGDGSAHIVNGVIAIERANYGESDIVRELIRMTYADAFKEVRARASEATQDGEDTTACDSSALRPRVRG